MIVARVALYKVKAVRVLVNKLCKFPMYLITASKCVSQI